MYVSKADLNKIKFRYATDIPAKVCLISKGIATSQSKALIIFIMPVFGHACFHFLQNSHLWNVKSKVDFGVPWCPDTTCMCYQLLCCYFQPYLSVVSLRSIMAKKQFSHDFCLPSFRQCAPEKYWLHLMFILLFRVLHMKWLQVKTDSSTFPDWFAGRQHRSNKAFQLHIKIKCLFLYAFVCAFVSFALFKHK